MARPEAGGSENPEKKRPRERQMPQKMRATLGLGRADNHQRDTDPRPPQQIFSKDEPLDVSVAGIGGNGGADLPPTDRAEFDDDNDRERKEKRKRCTEWTVASVLTEENSISSFPGTIISRFEPPGAEERATVSYDAFLSSEQNERVIKEERESRKSFGPAMVTRARELGLVEERSIEETKALVSPDRAATLASDIISSFGFYRFNGWDVSSSPETNVLYVFVPQRNDDGSVSVATVNLDALYQQDQSFVEEKVADYQIKEQRSRIGNRVEYNNALHEIAEEDLLPRFMREIATIDDPEIQAYEISSILNFARHLNKMGSEYEQAGERLARTLEEKSVPLDGGRNGFISGHLDHVTECTAETEEIRIRRKGVKAFYEQFQDIVHSFISEADDNDAVDHEEKAILDKPADYFYYAQTDPSELRTEKEKQVKIAQLVSRAENTGNMTELDHVVHEELPVAAAVLERFKDWLGNDYAGRNAFDQLIANLAKGILFGKDRSLASMQESIVPELERHYHSRGKFEGIVFDYSHSISITDADLYLLLPIYVLQKARQELQKREKSPTPLYPQKHIDQAKRSCEKIQNDLLDGPQQEIKRIDRDLIETAQRREQANFFKEEYGLLSIELASLAAITEEEIYGSGKRYIDPYTYTALFHALLLSKQGKVDLRSPAFKSFLQALYPNRSEAIEENL